MLLLINILSLLFFYFFNKKLRSRILHTQSKRLVLWLFLFFNYMNNKFNFLLALTFFVTPFLVHSQVGIGTKTPNPNAILDLTSTNKGLLIPRLTQTQVDSLMVNLNNSQNGLLVYNTSQQCVQTWDGVLLTFSCLAKVESGNEGIVVVDVSGALGAATNNTITHPSRMGWTTADAATWKQFNISPSNLAINLNKTDWPENQINPSLSAIFADNLAVNSSATPPTPIGTFDLWKENQDIPGTSVSQTHVWQISVLGNPGNANGGQFEARLRNPINNETVGYTQIIPAVSGLYSQTFTFITSRAVAAPFSGYVLEFRAQKGSLDIWIERITRTTLHKD